jgi:hypothetical protein
MAGLTAPLRDTVVSDLPLWTANKALDESDYILHQVIFRRLLSVHIDLLFFGFILKKGWISRRRFGKSPKKRRRSKWLAGLVKNNIPSFLSLFHIGVENVCIGSI